MVKSPYYAVPTDPAVAKPCIFIGSSLKDLRAFPADVRSEVGRAVYTVRFAGVVYVLHAFQKKSKKGIATPKPDIELIRRRLRVAEDHHRDRLGVEG